MSRHKTQNLDREHKKHAPVVKHLWVGWGWVDRTMTGGRALLRRSLSDPLPFPCQCEYRRERECLRRVCGCASQFRVSALLSDCPPIGSLSGADCPQSPIPRRCLASRHHPQAQSSIRSAVRSACISPLVSRMVSILRSHTLTRSRAPSLVHSYRFSRPVSNAIPFPLSLSLDSGVQ